MIYQADVVLFPIITPPQLQHEGLQFRPLTEDYRTKLQDNYQRRENSTEWRLVRPDRVRVIVNIGNR